MRLIDDWKQSHRLWSIRLGVVASSLVTYLLYVPEILFSILSALPPELSAVFPPFVGLTMLIVITLARLIQQKRHKNEK